MGGPAKAVQKVVSLPEKIVSAAVKTAEAVAEDPLPVIATVALISVGVPPELASAAVTAANGGDMQDIVTSAATAYVGGQAAEYAGSSASSAGSSATTAKIAASAAGASTATTLRELDNGKPFDEALESGLKSGIVSGSTTAVIETGKSALAPPETGQGIKAVPGKGTNLLGDQSKVSGTGLTEKVPTGGGQGLTVDPSSVLYTSQFTPSTGRVRGTEEGGLQPAYNSGTDYLTPDSFDSSIAPSTPYKEPKTVTQTPEPVISKTTEMLARPIIAGGLSELFGFNSNVPGARSAGIAQDMTTGTTTGTSVGLTGAGGAGEIESKESGKKRSKVWNEESLRLKDALGV
tara:strand:- start:169 stop:1209 length:1041 start_codon:yes stop_codon:yes gene_type:complete